MKKLLLSLIVLINFQSIFSADEETKAKLASLNEELEKILAQSKSQSQLKKERGVKEMANLTKSFFYKLAILLPQLNNDKTPEKFIGTPSEKFINGMRDYLMLLLESMFSAAVSKTESEEKEQPNRIKFDDQRITDSKDSLNKEPELLQNDNFKELIKLTEQLIYYPNGKIDLDRKKLFLETIANNIENQRLSRSYDRN